MVEKYICKYNYKFNNELNIEVTTESYEHVSKSGKPGSIVDLGLKTALTSNIKYASQEDEYILSPGSR